MKQLARRKLEAWLILLELKETAVLRDGDLAGIARND